MEKTPTTILETEWSHFISLDDLESGATRLSISPDAEARQRLCHRLGVVSLDSLKADIKITHGSGDVAFHVEGHIDAHVTQNCVVTLEPVLSHVEDDFEAWYADTEATISIAKARHERLNEKGHGELPILEDREDPESLVDGKMDLGELVTQYLCLSIDPYPHAEGVEFEEAGKMTGMKEDDLIKNPFAALKDWKDKLTNSEN